jgi:AcrR family transcriptional regulator
MSVEPQDRPEPPLLAKLLTGAADRTEEARDRILATAVQQISDFGVRGFTVDELARRVGLSRVTIYRHFPSKSDVLEAALLRELSAFIVEIREVVAGFDRIEDKAVEGFVFTMQTVRAHAVFQRLLRTEPEMFLPLLTTHGSPVIEAGRQLIYDLGAEQAEHGVLQVDPRRLEVLSEMLARLILSLVLTPESVAPVGDEAELRAFAREYFTQIIRGFEAG